MKWACGYVQVEMTVVSAFSRYGRCCNGVGAVFTHVATPGTGSVLRSSTERTWLRCKNSEMKSEGMHGLRAPSIIITEAESMTRTTITQRPDWHLPDIRKARVDKKSEKKADPRNTRWCFKSR